MLSLPETCFFRPFVITPILKGFSYRFQFAWNSLPIAFFKEKQNYTQSPAAKRTRAPMPGVSNLGSFCSSCWQESDLLHAALQENSPPGKKEKHILSYTISQVE